MSKETTMPERGVTEEDLGRVRELADLFDGDDPVGALDAASLRTLLSAFEAAEQRAEDAEAALARAEERERGLADKADEVAERAVRYVANPTRAEGVPLGEAIARYRQARALSPQDTEGTATKGDKSHD